MIVMTSMVELESLFCHLFDELSNGANQVVSKSSAVTTADASDKCQQQQDSTSSTSTLATTITADGNFDLELIRRLRLGISFHDPARNQRDLPRNTPLDRERILVMIEKRSKVLLTVAASSPCRVKIQDLMLNPQRLIHDESSIYQRKVTIQTKNTRSDVVVVGGGLGGYRSDDGGGVGCRLWSSTGVEVEVTWCRCGGDDDDGLVVRVSTRDGGRRRYGDGDDDGAAVVAVEIKGTGWWWCGGGDKVMRWRR
ncbi:hypothetical protein Tco_0767823 [Tanacetum coccineum]